MRLNQSPAQLYYIDQVLGAGAFIGHRESFKELRYRFMVYVETELAQDERDFLNKMLAAISETDYLLQVGDLSEETLAKHDINFAICFSKAKKTTRPVRWVELPSLATMLGQNVSTEQMNAAKKSAWALLKQLRQEMDAWCG